MNDDTEKRSPLGVGALGDFIKSQRRIADLSQRELARLADLSDAYLSQLERGLHEPSVRVLNGLAQALNVPSDKLLGYLGRQDDTTAERSTESVIATDDRLTDTQKQSLLDLYRAFIAANDVAAATSSSVTRLTRIRSRRSGQTSRRTASTATATVVDSMRFAVSSSGVSVWVRLTRTPATQPARSPDDAHIVNSVAASIS